MAKPNYPRCFRKAALCYIQQQEYARATAVIRNCRSNEAATHYVVFLNAVQQGRSRASQPFKSEMCKCESLHRVRERGYAPENMGEHSPQSNIHSIAAILAVRDMVQAKDFDRKMLLLATQLAHDANLKSVLLTVLDSLLTYLRSQKGFNNDVEALTMIR